MNTIPYSLSSSATVSNIDLFRVWKDEEDLSLDWLLQRIVGPKEQTPAMRAGEMFHKALETLTVSEAETITAEGYRFHFACDCEVPFSRLREMRVQKQYGGLEVRGRVDSLIGKMVIDYKTTSQFDPDRLMSGWQWRYYLDMTGADRFRWQVFVLDELDDPMDYAIKEVHVLEQTRYPTLHEDCACLASEYLLFAQQHLVDDLQITDRDIAEVTRTQTA